MSKPIIKPLDLPVRVGSAELEKVTKTGAGGLEIVFKIIMPGTITAKLTFPYTTVFSMIWIDAAISQMTYDERDESNSAAFSVITNSEYLSKLMTDKKLGLDADLKHYKLWFRDDVIEIIAPTPAFTIIKDWIAPYLQANTI